MYDNPGNEPTITYDGWQLPTNDPTLSIWYRTLDYTQIGLTPKVRKRAYREYAIDSLSRMADAMAVMLHPETFWVSDRQAVARTELKPHQLQLARKVGFNVPETLITTDPLEADRFIREQGRVVVKPIARRPPSRHNQYTRLFGPGELKLDGLRINPHILQAPIQPAFEVRAAVIGHRIFAERVWDDDESSAIKQGIRDFRHSFQKGTFRSAPIEMPAEIEDFCRNMNMALGLECGYYDFAVDYDGRYWFFEINANGQWGFVSLTTATRIGKALAELLETGVC